MAELKERLITRSRETEAEIEERITAAKWELEQRTWYDHVVVNDDLGTCVEEILKIIAAENCG